MWLKSSPEVRGSLGRLPIGLGAARKNFAGKSEELCLRIAPCVQGQLRFAAGFGQELFRAKLVRYCNLGKEQAAMRPFADQQTMGADLDFFGADGAWRRKQ